VGGSEWIGECGGGSIMDGCPVAVGLLIRQSRADQSRAYSRADTEGDFGFSLQASRLQGFDWIRTTVRLLGCTGDVTCTSSGYSRFLLRAPHIRSALC
jgi:hypothetical protein